MLEGKPGDIPKKVCTFSRPVWPLWRQQNSKGLSTKNPNRNKNNGQHKISYEIAWKQFTRYV